MAVLRRRVQIRLKPAKLEVRVRCGRCGRSHHRTITLPVSQYTIMCFCGHRIVLK